MNRGAQVGNEKKVIKQVERTLRTYKEILEGMNCVVRISSQEDEYIINFITGFERIQVTVGKEGKYEMQVL